MRIANSFWWKEGRTVVPEFLDLAQTYFDACAEEIDFTAPGAAERINAWVENATNDKIKDMVRPPIPPEVEAMLFNAIYFKGDWMFPFDTADTYDTLFYLADGSTAPCRMMYKNQEDVQQGDPDQMTETDTNITWYSDDEVWVLGMPYGSGDFRMSIIVPNPGWGWPPVSVSIDEIIAGLTYEKWVTWQNTETPFQFDLHLPKFRFEYEVTLNKMLQTLGMEIAFTPSADFGNLLEDGEIWISAVKQKTFVQCDEIGTEAAAVTQVIFATGLPPSLVCDRPFLIVIHEDVSGAVLFMGRISNPVWEE
jgi:serpin B